jgi:hypothetical protein
MFKGVLLQTSDGIDKEISAVSHPPVAFSQQILFSDSSISHSGLKQRNKISFPHIINCT